jgi:hypothetical protein
MLCAPRGDEYFIGAIGNDLIDIHVGLRSGPGLPDPQGKFGIEKPGFDFAGGGADRST